MIDQQIQKGPLQVKQFNKFVNDIVSNGRTTISLINQDTKQFLV